MTRRLPKQERSRKRYAHILDTAARLFERDGIEQVTTNHIADAAEVSIGSLYQFFPNKEAVIEALIERFLAELSDIFPDEIDTSLPLETIVRDVMGRVMAFEAEKSGFNEILLNAHTDMADNMHRQLVAAIERILGTYFADADREKHHLCAEVSLRMVKGMMGMNTLPPELLLEQIVIALTAYQTRFMNE